MQITKYSVRLPSADAADDVRVDLGKQESIGSSNLEEASGDVTG